MMISTFRMLAVAAAAAAVLPAQASQLTLGFDDLLPTPAVPVSLDGRTFSFNGQAAITFRNASAAGSEASVTRAGLPGNAVPERNPAGTPPNGFVINDMRAFTIDIDPAFSVYKLTLDYALGPLAGLDISLNDSQTASGTVAPTAAAFAWGNNSYSIELPGTDLIRSITFSSTSTVGLFAIDNLAFTLRDAPCTTNCGGTVPEPASFGIVSIALLGAGLASRRRRAG